MIKVKSKNDRTPGAKMHALESPAIRWDADLTDTEVVALRWRSVQWRRRLLVLKGQVLRHPLLDQFFDQIRL